MKVEFPKWIYHRHEAPKIVLSQEELNAQGPGWEETPAAFDKKQNEKAEKPKAGETEEPASGSSSEKPKTYIEHMEEWQSKDEKKREKKKKGET